MPSRAQTIYSEEGKPDPKLPRLRVTRLHAAESQIHITCVSLMLRLLQCYECAKALCKSAALRVRSGSSLDMMTPVERHVATSPE